MGQKKPPREKAGSGIDFGIGKLNLGGVLGGIGNLFDLLSDLASKGEEIKKTGEIGGLPEGMKGIYGFTIRTMAGQEPLIESFGNIKKTPKGPLVEEVREPIVDIIEEKETLLVVAELPGVDEKNISVEVKEDLLTLEASGKDRKYSKEILLPFTVDPSKMESAFHNGILELKLFKKPKGT